MRLNGRFQHLAVIRTIRGEGLLSADTRHSPNRSERQVYLITVIRGSGNNGD
jgi:hypothetical protein